MSIHYGLHRFKGGRPEHQMRWRGVRYQGEKWCVEVEQHLGTWGFPHTVSWKVNVLRIGR